MEKRNPRTCEIRRQLARVPPDSWLARYYSALQFSWLYIGLCGRILIFNADRLVSLDPALEAFPCRLLW